jgi:hypothetical protein
MYAVEQFAKSNKNVFPLFSTDPKQMAFTNDQQQTENRWEVDFTIQVNPVVTVSQQFFDTLTILAINAQTL